MDYIVPTWLILTIASALTIAAIVLVIVVFLVVRSWYQKRYHSRN